VKGPKISECWNWHWKKSQKTKGEREVDDKVKEPKVKAEVILK